MDIHSLKIVLILTYGFAFASLFGYITQRLKLSPILGYVVAGYLIGPFSPGFVADLEISEQLAEIGVILMMFGVGLHFKWQELLKVKGIAIPGALAQTGIATLASVFIMQKMGWSFEVGLIVGLSIGVASTVVLVRMLSDHQLLKTEQGHIAVGWLIVEDLMTIAFLLAIPVIAGAKDGNGISWMNLGSSLLFILFKFALLTAFMFTLGQKIVAYVLFKIVRTRSQELFTLTILALTFMMATGSALVFGTSIALGAFIAGMVIGQTHVRHQATSHALSIQDIFFVIFFLSVGMLFNPLAVLEHPLLFFAILAIILIIKPLTAFLICHFWRYPVKTSLTVAIALAQIGEFSFILSEEGLKYKILPDEAYDLIVACAIVSITLNPLLFKALDGFLSYFGMVKKLSSIPSQQVDDKPLAIIVGYGPIGHKARDTLEQMGYTPIIIDLNVDTITELILQKRQAVFGDATQEHILESAHIKTASILLITIPDSAATSRIVNAVRHIRSDLQILARIRFLNDRALIAGSHVEIICCEKEAMQAFDRALQKWVHKESHA